jgi:hypothetical protein
MDAYWLTEGADTDMAKHIIVYVVSVGLPAAILGAISLSFWANVGRLALP